MKLTDSQKRAALDVVILALLDRLGTSEDDGSELEHNFRRGGMAVAASAVQVLVNASNSSVPVDEVYDRLQQLFGEVNQKNTLEASERAELTRSIWDEFIEADKPGKFVVELKNVKGWAFVNGFSNTHYQPNTVEHAWEANVFGTRNAAKQWGRQYLKAYRWRVTEVRGLEDNLGA